MEAQNYSINRSYPFRRFICHRFWVSALGHWKVLMTAAVESLGKLHKGRLSMCRSFGQMATSVLWRIACACRSTPTLLRQKSPPWLHDRAAEEDPSKDDADKASY